jgi:hypothetical protein
MLLAWTFAIEDLSLWLVTVRVPSTALAITAIIRIVVGRIAISRCDPGARQRLGVVDAGVAIPTSWRRSTIAALDWLLRELAIWIRSTASTMTTILGVIELIATAPV